MNWQTELNNSFYWLMTALFWVTFSFILVLLLLKKSDFGKKFCLITQPCIQKSNRYKTIALILLLFALILLEVRISVLNSFFL